MVSAVGGASSLEMGSSQIQFPVPVHSFSSCQLPLKGKALSTGYLLFFFFFLDSV